MQSLSRRILKMMILVCIIKSELENEDGRRRALLKDVRVG